VCADDNFRAKMTFDIDMYLSQIRSSRSISCQSSTPLEENIARVVGAMSSDGFELCGVRAVRVSCPA